MDWYKKNYGVIKCYYCGKFCNPVKWQMVYSGYPPEPDREIFLCKSCKEKGYDFEPQNGIIPELSVGEIK